MFRFEAKSLWWFTHRVWGECSQTPRVDLVVYKSARDLSAEPVDGSSLALEGVDDIEGGDGLAASVLGVGDLQQQVTYR